MKKLIIILCLGLTTQLFCQIDSFHLIKPTGKYKVGTMTYEWTDDTRPIKLTSHQGDKRTIVVQLWYPATINRYSIRAPYSVLSKDYQKVTSNSYLRPPFNETLKRSKLILFSPGRGTERFQYTTIIEELASHGFVVAAVDMPQIGYVAYQDGLIIKPSLAFKPPRGMMGGPYEKIDEFFEIPTEMGWTDLEFVFQQIKALNSKDPNGRFTEKINLQSIGIFGHSLGGRIAGKFAVENENVAAYISMEGIPPRAIRYAGKLNFPVAMLCSSGTWPYAKENYFSLIDNRSNPVYMIELEGFGHNSVTDNPYLSPDNFKYQINPEVGLKISREVVLNYFDSILNKKNTFVNSMKNRTQIKFREYR